MPDFNSFYFVELVNSACADWELNTHGLSNWVVYGMLGIAAIGLVICLIGAVSIVIVTFQEIRENSRKRRGKIHEDRKKFHS